MPVLFVPPTQTVPFDAERLVEHRKHMDEFRSQIISLWQTQPQQEIKSGGFRGGRVYTWDSTQDAILQTYFVFSSQAKKQSQAQSRGGEIARIAALFRKDNCQLMGSAVVWGKDWSTGLPAGVLKTDWSQLKLAAQRNFANPKSPVRLSFEGHGIWGTAMAWIAESRLAENLASEGIIVHSDLAGLGCFRVISESRPVAGKGPETAETSQQKKGESQQKEEGQVLRRGHRQVRVVLFGKNASAAEHWPKMSGHFSILSLPFNQASEQQKKIAVAESPFSPDSLSAQVSTQILSRLHLLDDKNIRISKREGKFVTVERGIAFGLRIGMHLVGPDGAQLHVIRFLPQAGLEDAALLLIRSDSKSKPLDVGAVLSIDSTVYPVR